MQDVSTGNVFVASNVLFDGQEVPSFKTDEEDDSADFDDSCLSSRRQNPIVINIGNESNELRMGSSHVTVGHEKSWKKSKKNL